MNKGFTLIELLIYIAIIGGVISVFVIFGLSVNELSSKNYVVQEVHANARMALDLISQKIRAANEVNIGSSVFDSDPGVLSLSMASSAINPTVISLGQDNGVIQITSGSSDPVSITSDEVNVTNLVFTNLTGTGDIENIRVEITLEYNNPSGDVVYEYSQSLQTSVSLRQ